MPKFFFALELLHSIYIEFQEERKFKGFDLISYKDIY